MQKADKKGEYEKRDNYGGGGGKGGSNYYNQRDEPRSGGYRGKRDTYQEERGPYREAEDPYNRGPDRGAIKGGPQYTFENPLADEILDNVYEDEKEDFMDDFGGRDNYNDDYGIENEDYADEYDTQASRTSSKAQSSKDGGRSIPAAKSKRDDDEKPSKVGKYEESKSHQLKERAPKERFEVESEFNTAEDDQEFINEISNLNYAQGGKSEYVGSPCTIMMVAEKPSIALSITEALSNNWVKKAGISKSIPIYAFNGKFKGQAANFRVTSVAGHVYNRDFPKEYDDRRSDALKLFDARTVRKLDKHSRLVAKHLQAVSRGIDYIVLWLDCDKEGENICFEVLDICRRNIPKSRIQRVFRAKFSSIAKKDIQTAFDSVIN